MTKAAIPEHTARAAGLAALARLHGFDRQPSRGQFQSIDGDLSLLMVHANLGAVHKKVLQHDGNLSPPGIGGDSRYDVKARNIAGTAWWIGQLLRPGQLTSSRR